MKKIQNNRPESQQEKEKKYKFQKISLSRELAKIATERKELANFRDYTALRSCNFIRGEFTLRDLARIYKISNTSKFIKQRYKKFINSIFFVHTKGDRFRYVSYKRILIKYNNTANSMIYHLPGFAISTQRAFNDACIGICIGKEMSNDKAVKTLKFQKRRIQYATARNNDNGLIYKTIRKVVEPFGTFEDAKLTQIEAVKDGIYCGNPFRFKGSYAIALNRTNRYSSNISRRYKGKALKKAHETNETERKYKPAFRGKGARLTREKYENQYGCKFYEFAKNYSFHRFIEDYAV
jgi:hypothetical protein